MKLKIIIVLVLLTLVSMFVDIKMSDAKESKQYQVPENIDVGDILVMDFSDMSNPLQNSGMSNDHIAIYIGDDQFVHAKHFSKVEIKEYEYFQNNYVFLQFGYVKNASLSQKENAANWAKNQVGKRYQNVKKISAKGINNRWYDSELIWSAYHEQGIDIDADMDEDHNVVEVFEILNHLDIETYITHEIPSYLQKGDIILMDVDTEGIWGIDGYSNDHAALYMGHDFRDGSYAINAGIWGVQYMTFDSYNMLFENFTFFKVNAANEEQRNSAVEWTVNHLGYKYQFFFPCSIYRGMWELGLKCEDTDNPDVLTSNRFYCMELVWAAYYDQGIDIDNNGWEKIYPKAPSQLGILANLWQMLEGILFEEFAYVTGDDIIHSQNTTQYIN